MAAGLYCRSRPRGEEQEAWAWQELAERTREWTQSLWVHSAFVAPRQAHPYQLAADTQTCLTSLSLERKASHLIVTPQYTAEVRGCLKEQWQLELQSATKAAMMEDHRLVA